MKYSLLALLCLSPAVLAQSDGGIDVQRLMIDLNMQRGFSHQEIVDITDVPLGTVKSHLQRARGKLQR